MTAVLETYRGKFIDLDRPKPEDIVLDDIAVALANTCRFGGHVSRYYSVAEHAVLVYRLVCEFTDSRPLVRLAALHHDSHEAYVGDIPTPIKRAMGWHYTAMVNRLDSAITRKFGIPYGGLAFEHELIHHCDQLALALEARELKVSCGRGEHWERLPSVKHAAAFTPFGLSPDAAAAQFQRTHYHALAAC